VLRRERLGQWLFTLYHTVYHIVPQITEGFWKEI
jgi:hypothetical protein